MPETPSKLRPHPSRLSSEASPAEHSPAPIPYAELAITSNFTFLTGASHPEELIARAAQLGHSAAAITDTNSLAGIVRAHIAARECGIPLAIGCRLVLRHPEGLSLLVFPTDRASYARLCRLLTLGKRRAEKGDCSLTLADLLEHSEGLLAVIVPCAEIPPSPGWLEALPRLRETFDDDRLSLAIARTYGPHDAAYLRQSAELAREHRIPLVAINDVHYHLPQRRPLQDVITCIRLGCTIEEAGLRLNANAERHLKPPEEMARLFAESGGGGSVERSAAIARRAAAFSLDELRYEYPDEVVPAGCTPMEYLTELTWQGARERYPSGIPEKIRSLVEHELELIADLNYAPYFLTVYDLVAYARRIGILCQGRGAAANSAVCYCLGVTSVDPDRIDTLFERFVSRERNEPPDIDIDFEHERREEVIQYLYGKYGRDRAALTAEVITYRGRSAVREVGKAMGLSLDCVDRLAKSMDWWDGGVIDQQRIAELGLNPSDPTIRLVLKLAGELLGFPRHLSQHVGGFVLTRGLLCETVPIENAAMPDRTVIEWDKDDIDALGILKVDVLGLGMLTAIRKCFELVNGWNTRPDVFAPNGATECSHGWSDIATRRRGDVAEPVDSTQNSFAPEGRRECVPAGEMSDDSPDTNLSHPRDDDCSLRPSGAEEPQLTSTTGSADFLGSTRGYTPAPLRGEEAHSLSWTTTLATPSPPSTPAPLALHTIPPEDPVVYDMICRADTVGVFQIESRAQMSMLPRLKPRCYYDLVIEVAIVRPGPIQGNMVHPYLRRRDGLEPVTYPDDAVRAVLGRTLGVPLFQEQAMRLAIVAAGFTADEADQLRRAMAAWKRKGDLIFRFGRKLISGMLARGYPREFAERCFEQIKGFSEYGFPESHAASFALLVYISSWLKCHHPAAFAAALLNSQPMGFYPPAQLVRDAREHGVEVRPVDVNFSGWDCVLEGRSGSVAKWPSGKVAPDSPTLPLRHSATWPLPALRLGTRLVRGLQETEARAIEMAVARHGPFRSIAALRRASGVRVATLRALAAADAFTSMGLDRQAALWEIRTLSDEQLPMFDNLPMAELEPPRELAQEFLPPIPEHYKVGLDYNALGLSLRSHPMTFLREALDEVPAITAAELRDENRSPAGRNAAIAGLVLVRQRPATANGIVFMTIEDETGAANLIIREEVYRRYRRALRSSAAILARGRVERRGAVVHILVQSARALDDSLRNLRVTSRDFH